VTEHTELQTPVDEPSPEDFEAAEQEAAQPEVGPRSVLVRVLRLAGVLFVVVALVFYLAVPVGVFLSRVSHDWLRPHNPIHSVPLVPEPTATPPART